MGETSDDEERCYPLPGETWTKSMLLPRLHVGSIYVIDIGGSQVKAVLLNVDDEASGRFAELDDHGIVSRKRHILTWEWMANNPPCSPNQTAYWSDENVRDPQSRRS